ncbi:MAG: glycosyltransferase family 2 protein [Eubacteriaceae bacterium]|nr:glycosyltransferase family 2 protein [Eubacteriaceae bacterium]
MKQTLTIVVPVYNEAETVALFYEEVRRAMSPLSEQIKTEILFVDDGSEDETKAIISKMSRENENVGYLSFSRNFGKEAAILAGLSEAMGDLIAVMDVDLQDPPALLPEMIERINQEGYDVVCTRRKSRKGEPWLRALLTKCYYGLMRRISKTPIVDGARDFRVMTRPFVEAVLSLGEYNRFSKGLFSWVGFNQCWIAYDNVPRAAGKSKFSYKNLFYYAADSILSFSTAPILGTAALGLLFCLVAFVMIAVIIVKTVVFGDPTSGWPSLACIVLLVSGVQMLGIGVVGAYLGKTYMETKKRPLYIIKEKNICRRESRKC